MEKEVKVSYKEYQDLLSTLEKQKGYIKELETKNNVIILHKSFDRFRDYHYSSGVEYNIVFKGIEGVTDKLKEFEEELKKQIVFTKKKSEEFNEAYERVSKLKENWIYKLFYKK